MPKNGTSFLDERCPAQNGNAMFMVQFDDINITSSCVEDSVQIRSRSYRPSKDGKLRQMPSVIQPGNRKMATDIPSDDEPNKHIYIYTYTHTNIVIFRINMGRIGSALSFQDLSGQSLRCPAVPYPEKWPSSPHVPLASEDHTLGMEAMPRCANQDRSMPQFTTSMMRSDLQLGVAFITLSTTI